MEFDNWVDVLGLVATTFVGVAGLLISNAVFRLSSLQREDSWMRHFGEIHDHFWNDSDMITVRSWLACEESYTTIDRILKKRREAPQDTTVHEYREIEKLDKFLNLMTIVVSLEPRLQKEKNILEAFFFSYWLKLAVGEVPDSANVRQNMSWYVKKHYPAVTNYHNKICSA